MNRINREEIVMLDVEHMVLSSKGVDGFFWPVGFHEVEAVRDAMVRPFVRVLRQALSDGRKGAREIAILSPYYVTEVMTLFQAKAFQSRSGGGLEQIVLPSAMPIWKGVLDGQVPPVPSFFVQLMNSFQPAGRKGLSTVLKKLLGRGVKKWKKKACRKKTVTHVWLPSNSGIKQKRIHSRRLTRRLLAEHIVCTKRGRIQSAHAASVKQRVILGQHKMWFGPIAQELVDSRLDAALNPVLENDLVETMCAAFQIGNLSLPKSLELYLRSILRLGAAIVQIHTERLLANQKKLPKKLWTGTGGNVWDRMLRAVVREQGGEVCGHSHAGGSEHVNNPYIAFNEFPFVDKFVVYSEQQRESTLHHANSDVLFEKKFPQVVVPTALRKSSTSRIVRPSLPEKSSPVKKIMYVATSIYHRDRLNLYPAIPDIVAVDWQARLFAHLKQWGYEILHKPHPESCSRPPRGFQDLFGVSQYDCRFEECLEEADLFIFDTQSTSTFPVALCSMKPMVFVDLGRFSWEPQAFQLLKKRCGVVPARFDEDNRIVLEWADLRQAIADAPALAGDVGLQERFFG